MMESLNALSPLDGRYARATESLRNYFSEAALIRYRVKVEVRYLKALVDFNLPGLDTVESEKLEQLSQWGENLSEEDLLWVKETEKTTNHDVKAVEYLVKKELKKLGLEKIEEFVHFGLTSQDINNTSVPLSLKEAIADSYLPKVEELRNKLAELSDQWKDISLLARTHGQPASPTKLGKEIKVFVERLDKQIKALKNIPIEAKFGGATGGFNAHKIAYPNLDWVAFANNFVSKYLGLERQQTTTQIEHYDNMAAMFQAMMRINTILLDLDRDMWTYISFDYFKQQIKAGEVGSSAMPHKVNPIDFENSEGNLGLANALFEHLANKLPISRLQRDLTDSTVLRNIGVPFGHTLIAFGATMRGLNKVIVNENKIRQDLEANWAVAAEAIQTVLRRIGYPQPYEALKALTRTNEGINEKSIKNFIETLDVDASIKAELLNITPWNYTGVSLV